MELYLQKLDGSLWGLTKSQHTTSIHVTGPPKINQDAASPQRVLSYSIWSLVALGTTDPFSN